MKTKILLSNVIALIFFLFATSVYAIGLESVLGVWLFDKGEEKTLKDFSENENNGKIIQAEWVDGKKGNALKFNGSTSYVEVPSSDSLNSIENEITITAWIKVENWANWARVVARGPWTSAMDQYQFLLLLGGSQGDVGFCVSIKGEKANYAGKPVLKLGKWHHVAGSSDGRKLKLYVDGELLGTKGSAAPINQMEEDPLTIGCGYSGNDRASFFSGTIDEVGLFNKALRREEIKSIMNEGLFNAVGISAVSPKKKLSISWANLKRKQ